VSRFFSVMYRERAKESFLGEQSREQLISFVPAIHFNFSAEKA
jgi:hypothetical protein